MIEELAKEKNQKEPVLFEYLKPKFDKKIFLYFFIVLFILISFYFMFFSIPKDFPVGKILNIKEGASLRSISKDLDENKLIRSRVVFETLVIIWGGEKRIKSGDYLFESRMSVFEIARRVSKAEKHLAPVKVTIPEGFNIKEISETFSSRLPNFNEDKFLLEAKNKEGYLFPDTYFFLTTDNEQDVLSSMQNNFEKKIAPFRSRIISSGKNERDIIVMASLIEEESKGDLDRAYISGILWRRIYIGMPLQVDAEPSTYKNKGLPKDPISNPGIKAIEAAVNPKNSSFLYYLHDKDGNIHYAKTFAEHKINKLKYLK